MYRNFSLVSSTPAAKHLAEFSRMTLEVDGGNLHEITAPQEKLDFVSGIKRLGVLFIKDASRRPASMASEVQLGLSTLWDVFISATQILDLEEDMPLYDQLVLQVLWTKEFDTLCRGLYPSANPFPSWEAYQFAERLQRRWDQLFATADSESEPELQQQQQQQHSLAIFSAKVLAAGICRDLLARTGLSCLREALEGDDEAKTVARLPVAVAWIHHCHHQLLAFSVMNQFSGENSDNGYSLGRWLSWRKRFQELSHHADRAAASEAKKGFMSMMSCGLDLDCDVPGEAEFREKVAVALRDELVASGKPSVVIGDIDVDVDWVDQVEAA